MLHSFSDCILICLPTAVGEKNISTQDCDQGDCDIRTPNLGGKEREIRGVELIEFPEPTLPHGAQRGAIETNIMHFDLLCSVFWIYAQQWASFSCQGLLLSWPCICSTIIFALI